MIKSGLKFKRKINIKKFIMDTLEIKSLNFTLLLKDMYNDDLGAFYLDTLNILEKENAK
jgi:hypothetical protein